MRRFVRVVFFGPLTLFMVLLLTAVYPLWRASFWVFNDPTPPPRGYWKEVWREWWDEVIIAP